MGRKKKRLTFDIETEPFTNNFRKAVSMAERRKHAPKLRVACVFDEAKSAYRYYTVNDAKELIKDLLSADELISFNGKGYDLLVLQRHHGLRIKQAIPKNGKHTDVHEVMTAKAGFRVSLNVAVQVNFGERKHTDGRKMTALSLEELKEACRSDVSQTYRLWKLHTDDKLRIPAKEFGYGSRYSDDEEGGTFMPDICPNCHDVGSVIPVEADSDEMTEGQFAEYMAGTWGYLYCTTCKRLEFWEM